MNQRYWNGLADGFGSKILDIVASETNGNLRKTIRKLAKNYRTAGDFGCGVGRTTSLLSSSFNKVVAIDYAQELLLQAQKRVTAKNVRFIRSDLSRGATPAAKVGASFCINVLIHPAAKKRKRIARAVFNGTRRGGRAVFVVPSLESFLRTYQVLIECRVKQGGNRKKTVRSVAKSSSDEIRSLVEGIFDVGGIATKHYMHDEIAELLRNVGFRISSIARVEFPWSEELEHAPKWLKKPYPWDWLVAAKKS